MPHQSYSSSSRGRREESNLDLPVDESLREKFEGREELRRRNSFEEGK
jgi:hypothetical protein